MKIAPIKVELVDSMGSDLTVTNAVKHFNQDEMFRDNCAKTQHNWGMDSNHQIDLTAYSGYRSNPHQIHVGAKCLTCGYCACKHCELIEIVNECGELK